MVEFTKVKLSASNNGRQIKVAATGTPGTLIHTAINSTTDWDEVWLYATNNHTSDVVLTIEYGGTTSPDDLMQMAVPAKSGLYLIIPGLIINGNTNIRAYASTANVISISGWVNRIIQT